MAHSDTQDLLISHAPLGYASGDNNLYRYVTNAPATATDPSGMRKVRRALLQAANAAAGARGHALCQSANDLFSSVAHYHALHRRDKACRKK
jgi:hypothetical protein